MENIFIKKDGKLFIAGKQISDDLQIALEAEAIYLQSSHLLEVLSEVIKQEVFDLAIVQSKKWEDIQFSKGLHHWHFVFINLINKLSKK